ncbi:MAG: UDP-N-acetylglucosamine 1-carboxyvinyltransferase [Elusimicrobiales bacterium]|nr:UDP-N-acetylglucosamine 1-carboxyvinyltransferase [Elusimicrobiales bacterium]
MECFIIEGPNIVTGEVKVSGAKNSALPILFATILTEDKCIVENVPELSDIKTTYDLLNYCGKECFFGFNRFEVSQSNDIKTEAPYDLVRKMRASVLIAGPMLAKYKRVKFSMPGGCAIGVRPIDIHLDGFKKLGADIKLEEGYVIMSAKHLHGARITLKFPSVGATENIMMVASLIDDLTIIENAAKEPEIVDLSEVLNKMGACIEGAGSGTIKIRGKKKLSGFRHKVIPDRIECGTFMILGALIGKELAIKNAHHKHLNSLIKKLKMTGVCIDVNDNDTIIVNSTNSIKPVNITTQPYPGFPTDLQAQWMSYMSVANGKSIITEKIFENRFMHAAELIRMGANIIVKGSKAYIEGVKRLKGATVMVSDLRAGAGLVLAGCIAEGITKVRRIYHIDRGYEKIDEKLKLIGVKIKREEE